MIKLPDSAEPAAMELMPLMDILFILLLFFLLTAGAAVAPMPVALVAAQGSESSPMPDTPLQLSVDATGVYVLDERRYSTTAELMPKLLARYQASADATLLIAGDQQAPLQALVSLLDALQKAQVERVQLLHQREMFNENK